MPWSTNEGRLVWDLPLLQLLINPGDTVLGDLVGEAEPVTVGIHAGVAEVAERLIEARRMSVVVVTRTAGRWGGSWPTTSSTPSCRNGGGSTSPGCCSERVAELAVNVGGGGCGPCR